MKRYNCRTVPLQGENSDSQFGTMRYLLASEKGIQKSEQQIRKEISHEMCVHRNMYYKHFENMNGFSHKDSFDQFVKTICLPKTYGNEATLQAFSTLNDMEITTFHKNGGITEMFPQKNDCTGACTDSLCVTIAHIPPNQYRPVCATDDDATQEPVHTEVYYSDSDDDTHETDLNDSVEVHSNDVTCNNSSNNNNTNDISHDSESATMIGTSTAQGLEPSHMPCPRVSREEPPLIPQTTSCMTRRTPLISQRDGIVPRNDEERSQRHNNLMLNNRIHDKWQRHKSRYAVLYQTNEERWCAMLAEVEHWIEVHGKRPSKVSTDLHERRLAMWISTQLKNERARARI